MNNGFFSFIWRFFPCEYIESKLRLKSQDVCHFFLSKIPQNTYSYFAVIYLSWAAENIQHKRKSRSLLLKEFYRCRYSGHQQRLEILTAQLRYTAPNAKRMLLMHNIRKKQQFLRGIYTQHFDEAEISCTTTRRRCKQWESHDPET